MLLDIMLVNPKKTKTILFSELFCVDRKTPELMNYEKSLDLRLVLNYIVLRM